MLHAQSSKGTARRNHLVNAVTFGVRRAWENLFLIGGTIVAILAIVVVVYCLSRWPDFIYHMELSLARLVLQLVPVGLFAIALAIPKLPQRAND